MPVKSIRGAPGLVATLTEASSETVITASGAPARLMVGAIAVRVS